ncbi:MAG: phosphoglycerate dehydrogenase [Bacteroidetes bacterium]|nr:phosphoglycerate dehydrogenase [Bacteroidota bacterium]
MTKVTSYPKDRIKILLLEGVHQNAVDEFARRGYNNINYQKKAFSEEELLDCIEDYHLIGIRSKTNITAKVLEKAKKLMAIGCFCIGTNQVDLKTATEKGVAVFNSPYSNTRSVAELIIAESIMLLRRIPARDKAAHEGIWLKDARGSYELRGKTIGIIGYGHIGSQVSVLAESMGLKVQYFDVETKLPLGNAQSVRSMEELISTSDIVTLHVPETPETKNMITAKELGWMKKGSIFLNLSRGTVTDIEALRDAIVEERISGAAVDVFPKEPKAKDERFVSPLQGLDNVILTPHIGGSTQEAQENIGLDTADKLSNYLDNGSTMGCHTVPAVSLPVQRNTHRILHIHDNVPGVLSDINSRMSRLNVNIMGQYLKTNERIGYVVLDVEGSATLEAIEELKTAGHTIKARILF